MGQRFTHNGVEYEELGGGKVRVIGGGAASRASFTATPLPLSPEQQAEEDRRRRDQQIQEQAAHDRADADARARQEWLATHNADGSPKEKPSSVPPGYRATADGNLQFIPGGPADPARNGKALRQGDSDKLRAAVNQFADMSRIRSNFQPNFGGNFAGGLENWAQGYVSGIGTPGQHDWWSDMANMDNVIRNGLFGASLTDGEKQAYNRTTITPGMDPREIQKNLTRREGVMRGALQRYIGGLKAGGWSGQEIDALVGDQTSNLYPQQASPNGQQQRQDNAALGGPGSGPGGPPPPNAMTQNNLIPGGSPGAASFGADQKSVPIPAPMQAEYGAWLAKNAATMTPDDYVAYRQQLDQKYGFGSDDTANRAWAEDSIARLKRGGATINTTIPGITQDMTTKEWLRNSAVSNPIGAFAANMGNAGGFGIPRLLASDQMQALKDANPTSSLLGDITGSISGTMITGAGLAGAGGSRLLGNTAAGRVLSNPLAADVTYGGIYGATQSDDPIHGAVGGAGSALVGSVIGNRLGRAVPGWLGFNPPNPLSRGEQAVLTAAERTGVDDVVTALRQSSDLGIPVTPADVSMDINSLTGAATRRSPVAAALARGQLGARSRGQYDRFVGAVGRDLGPLDNVLERSNGLMQKARDEAAPLYAEAYGAPVVSTPELASLLDTPFGRQATGRARTIAANERRNPEGMGFALDESGDAVLNPIPHESLGALGAAERRMFEAEAELRRSQSSLMGSGGAAQAEYDAAVQALNDARSGLAAQPTVGMAATSPGYTTQTLDYVKRGMDDVLEQYRNPITGRLVLDEAGRAQNGVLRSLLSEVDNLNPAYGQARAAYAGPAAEAQALREGSDAINLAPDQLAVQVGSKTPSQLGQMQLGFRDALAKKADSLRYSSNPFESTLGTPAMEQRLGTLYPEGEGNVARLLLQRDVERDIAASTNRMIGNSFTAERGIADEAFAQGGGLGDAALEIGANVALGQVPIGTAIRGGLSQGLRDQFRLGIGRRGRELAEQVVPLALETSDQAIARLLSMRQQQDAYSAVVRALSDSRGAVGGHIGAGTGSSVAAALMAN